MNSYVFEFLGTAILIILGNGVVANVLLPRTNGQNAGLLVIAFAWAIAVFTGVYIAAPASGAHLNPAVTLALCLLDKFSWHQLPGYWLAQLTGAIAGSVVVWLTYKKHFDSATDADAIRSTFCTSAAISNPLWNFVTEVVASFVLVLGILFIAAPTASLGALDALPVALLVLGIGLSLGGPTGYAINPARDLGPRIAHALLPITHKGSSHWHYAWIPVVAPLAGSALASLLFYVLKTV